MKVSDTTVQVSLVAASLLLSSVSATAQEASDAAKTEPQEVVVTDPLDLSAVDLSTVALGNLLYLFLLLTGGSRRND